jgi:NTP pyrophosphatase (non-canonical NTP hydrolase)
MKDKYSLEDLQKQTDMWIKSHGGYWPPLSMLSAVLEELGELSREINYVEGYKPKKEHYQDHSIGEELADTVFALICIANHYQINLQEEFRKVLKKYSNRDANRFT